MKKVIVSTLMTAVLLTAFAANAQVRSWDNLDWWAQSGAKADPVKDAVRSGSWWWPTEPVSNVDDKELWGNRGVVYGTYTPKVAAVEAPKAPAAPPAAPKAPSVERQVPVFNHVLFDFDKSTVKPEGRTEIKKVADLLKQYSKDTLTVEGHTDNVNRSGDKDYNQKLGQRRADAVVKVLTESGAAANRVSAASFGDTKPAVPNDTDANRALNRRVVFVYKVVP
jgi:outer membrane protein OmpA-like peptidoglycan-associated protein